MLQPMIHLPKGKWIIYTHGGLKRPVEISTTKFTAAKYPCVPNGLEQWNSIGCRESSFGNCFHAFLGISFTQLQFPAPDCVGFFFFSCHCPRVSELMGGYKAQPWQPRCKNCVRLSFCFCQFLTLHSLVLTSFSFFFLIVLNTLQ